MSTFCALNAVWVCRLLNIRKVSAVLVNFIRTAVAHKAAQFNVDKRAVTAIEYALIAALIAVVIIAAVTSLGKGVSNTFNSVASEL
ncbi:Flp family type IVb pilin [Acidocella aminolytica]|uniref:Flp family type IVb pilin n=1 Tax=Acidocella aminolytica TaxID=33998 RepID=UPI001F51CCA6|nr:Flp family type IVb pilin [Acidocella aminolytica]